MSHFTFTDSPCEHWNTVTSVPLQHDGHVMVIASRRWTRTSPTAKVRERHDQPQAGHVWGRTRPRASAGVCVTDDPAEGWRFPTSKLPRV